MAKLGKVRPLALAVIRQDDRIFVSEGFDALKGQAFCRPLGGGIEFGERGADAVVREMREELSVEIIVDRYFGTFENIFTYAGKNGHEIVLLFEARFADPELYSRSVIEGIEPDDGGVVRGTWRSLADFGPDLPLYPDGLLTTLQSATGK